MDTDRSYFVSCTKYDSTVVKKIILLVKQLTIEHDQNDTWIIF